MTPTGGSPESRAASSQAGLILFVDDEKDVRNTMFGLLQGTEFRSVGAASAAEAIEAVKKSQPRAILLDWTLPGGISGLTLLRALKGALATRHIPVVMISGLKRSEAERLAVRQAGAEDLYDKCDLLDRKESFLTVLRDAVAKNKSPSTWKLLVVEDDTEVQGFIRFALARRGFDIHFAGTGRAGCALARELRPNLIVLDMSLPDLNGVGVIKNLRADRETRGIPILAMSALDKAAGPLESALKELGVDDYLPKPFGENELLQRLSQLLGRVSVPRPREDILVRGRVRLDLNARHVWVGERLIEHVGYKQFDLLHVLLKTEDGVSREELQLSLWDGVANSKALDMTVGRLRKALGFGKNEGIIAIPQGYKLVG